MVFWGIYHVYRDKVKLYTTGGKGTIPVLFLHFCGVSNITRAVIMDGDRLGICDTKMSGRRRVGCDREGLEKPKSMLTV